MDSNQMMNSMMGNGQVFMMNNNNNMNNNNMNNNNMNNNNINNNTNNNIINMSNNWNNNMMGNNLKNANNDNLNSNQINNMQNNNILLKEQGDLSFSKNKLKTEVENNTKLNEQIVFLTFTFEKYNKNIFIEVDGNDKFNEVIQKLEEKYSWLTTINNKIYYYNGNQIPNFNLTLNELGIVDNSDIKVII